MKKNFRETIHQRPDDELNRIAKDYAFYSTAERLLAMNELKKRKRLPDDLAESKKTIGGVQKKIDGNFIGVCFLPILFFLVSLVIINRGIERQNLTLRDTVRYEGVVASVGEFTWRMGARGSERLLGIRLYDVNRESRQFVVFRVGQRYNDLAEKIDRGDILVIHYWRTRRGSEAVQIEKNGNIVLSINDTNQQGSMLLTIWILVALGCVLFLVGFVRGELRLSREGKPRSRKRRAD